MRIPVNDLEKLWQMFLKSLFSNEPLALSVDEALFQEFTEKLHKEFPKLKWESKGNLGHGRRGWLLENEGIEIKLVRGDNNLLEIEYLHNFTRCRQCNRPIFM
jgi:hypothetical protein